MNEENGFALKPEMYSQIEWYQMFLSMLKECKKIQLENARLKDKIDKATEYIEWQKDNPQYYNIWRNYECNELLKILKEN